MSANTKSRRGMFLENLTHYLTAFVVMLKGLDKIATPGKTGVAIFFLAAGVFILLGTIFHKQASSILKHFKGYILGIEAVVMAIVGYLFLQDGKQLIHYVCFSASVMFLVALTVYIRRRTKSGTLRVPISKT